MALIDKQVWARQPQGIVKLVGTYQEPPVFIHTGRHALINGRIAYPEVNTLPAKAASLYRPSAFIDSTSLASGSSQYLQYSLSQAVNTLSVWVVSNDTSLGISSIIHLGFNNTRSGFGIARSGEYTQALLATIADTNGRRATSNYAITADNAYHACVVQNANATVSLYINGIFHNESTVGALSGSDKLFLGASHAENSFGAYASNFSFIGLPMAFKSRFSAGEVLNLYKQQLKNPWQIFAPEQSKSSVAVPLTRFDTPIENTGVPATVTTKTLYKQSGDAIPNPKYRPVVVWTTSSPYVELASNNTAVLNNTKVDSSIDGNFVDVSASLTKRITISNAKSPGSNFIVVVRYKCVSSAPTQWLVAGKATWSDTNGFGFAFKAGEPWSLELNGGDGSTFPVLNTSGITGFDSFAPGSYSGKWRTLVVKYSGTSASVYYEGIYLGQVTIVAAGTWPTGIGIGNYSSGGAPGNNGYMHISLAAVVLEGDPLSLSKNPWQIFKAHTEPIWSGPLVLQSYTFSVPVLSSPGVFSITSTSAYPIVTLTFN